MLRDTEANFISWIANPSFQASVCSKYMKAVCPRNFVCFVSLQRNRSAGLKSPSYSAVLYYEGTAWCARSVTIGFEIQEIARLQLQTYVYTQPDFGTSPLIPNQMYTHFVKSNLSDKIIFFEEAMDGPKRHVDRIVSLDDLAIMEILECRPHNLHHHTEVISVEALRQRIKICIYTMYKYIYRKILVIACQNCMLELPRLHKALFRMEVKEHQEHSVWLFQQLDEFSPFQSGSIVSNGFYQEKNL